LSAAVNGQPKDVRLVVPNLPDAIFAPVPEQSESAGTQASATAPSADNSATLAFSTSSPGSQGMAIAGTNCQGGSSGSLQVLAGA
jgi:hypothetical protein